MKSEDWLIEDLKPYEQDPRINDDAIDPEVRHLPVKETLRTVLFGLS